MKKLTILLLLMILHTITWAQSYYPLVDTNKVWSIAHSWGQPFVHTSDFIKFLGDTAFNGYEYKQVWKTSDTTLEEWSSYGYIREENKKVYYLSWSGGSPNNLIYDFNVSTGDTVYLFDDPMGSFLMVDSIGTFTLLSGEIRKKINLSCHWPGSTSGFISGNDTWIEGMGSLFGVLGSGTCLLVGDNPQLLCFHENDTLKYFNDNFSSCYILTGIDPHGSNRETVKVFPNPTSGAISISIKDLSVLPVKIVFYNPLGQVLYDKTVRFDGEKIDLSSYEGYPVLFYTITGLSGNTNSSGKILLLNEY